MAPDGGPIDALLPSEMAASAEQVGVRKAQLEPWRTFVLAVLAGAFISLGAIFSTSVSAGSDGLPWGVARLLAGSVFSLGLVLVVVGGAELFTGNNLIVMAWASGKVSTRLLLRNWGVVYLGNLAGSLATAAVMFATGQYGFASGAVGLSALHTAHAKLGLGLTQAFFLGVMCNALVCLAVWLTYSARSTTDRILCVLFPIAAFVTAGFEHCVANMYFVPVAIFIKAGAGVEFWSAIQASPADFPLLGWQRFLAANLLPVTLGNVVGGSLMVGATYWFVYLRGTRG